MGDYKIKNSKTFRLFAIPSFASGVASAFDLFPDNSTINDSASSNEADMKAMKADFEMAGKDLKEAFYEWEKEFAK
ncbi:hypothetical protein KCG48_04865 [Proteiniclasticum sp. BAD-10]|uniref:Uncharacterized protein n=1 Tax=Proteiniclasticum sediminis TaxID=2804028 RepID=A0A941CMZ8_9CLOT|nr:hypothetical protein [Proteiniclasticum sediminis]MBR0575671.1 hypothetical protein [Proteiniclasticum sediminis]